MAPLFQVAWPAVRDFARSALRHSHDADDVAQQTLLRVFERIHQFDSRRGDGLTWLFTLCRFEVRTHLKKRLRRREDHIEVERAANDTPLDDAMIERRLVEAVHAALATLSDDDRQTILRRIHDNDDASANPATRRKRWQRALSRLRVAMGAEHAPK